MAYFTPACPVPCYMPWCPPSPWNPSPAPFSSAGDCFNIYFPDLPCGDDGGLPCHLCTAYPFSGPTHTFMQGRTMQIDCCRTIPDPDEWGLDLTTCNCGFSGPTEYAEYNTTDYPFNSEYGFYMSGRLAGSYSTFLGTSYSTPADGFVLKGRGAGLNQEAIYFIAYEDVPCGNAPWVFDLLVDEFPGATGDSWPATLTFTPCAPDGRGVMGG